MSSRKRPTGGKQRDPANASVSAGRRNAAAPIARAAPGRTRTPALAPWLIPLLVVAAGLAAYYDSFSGPFLFDDNPGIVDNPRVRQLWPPWAVMAGTSRPVVLLSFAVNFALGGLDVRGYHVFNLAIHLLAGLTLLGIVRRMLESERLRARYGAVAPWLAGVVAIVWTVHPLQTQSVTYVVQRAESMMGLFFLLTLYCVIRGVAAARPLRWYAGAVASCALGMGSKEVMVVAPVVVLLYDRMFIAASFRDILRQRWRLYVALFATWIVLAFGLATNREAEQVILVADLTPWRYALTQFGVIVHYLRLAFWPAPLVLDYGWQLDDRLSSVLPWAAIVGLLLGATLVALYRRFWAGFWGAWFFLILSPTSTVVPIADVAFEHRMYLPLAAVAVLVVIGTHSALAWGQQRLGASIGLRQSLEFGIAALVIVALGATTVRRNDDYRTEQAMWTDNVAKRPDNPRVHFHLGYVFDRQGKYPQAIAEYREALRLKPDYPDALSNLGGLLAALGQADEAMEHLLAALQIRPSFASARNNLGAALFAQRKYAEAVEQFSQAVRLQPGAAHLRDNLGVVLTYNGQAGEALAHFAAAIGLDPGKAGIRDHYADALLQLGRFDEAIAQYTEALRLDPNRADIRQKRAAAMARAGGAPPSR